MSEIKVGNIVAVVGLVEEDDNWFVVPTPVPGSPEQDEIINGYKIQGYGKVTSIEGETGWIPEGAALAKDNRPIVVQEYIKCRYDEEIANKILGA